MSLLLFDIDGTLLLSGGAGIRAMTRAFDDVFAVRDAFAGSDVAGRTDRFIVSRALAEAGLPDTREQHDRFREAYVPLLRKEILRPATGRYGLMPGIQGLLEALRESGSVHVALLTGNYAPAAFVKLGHFGIESFFEWGAFGEESAERDELARIALRRAESRGVPAAAREQRIVIGDTPHDVACARAIGARMLAVATGNYSEEALRAAGADVILPDLSDTSQVLRVLRRN
ncbi:MAG TPA: HAD family hydrolase [Vicinamibacterales bacterium]|nr:HAD family hydrolase [Vicinamibacterales bacterium]